MGSSLGSRHNRTTICAIRSDTVGTVTSDYTRGQQAFRMGHDHPSFPPPERPPFSVAQVQAMVRPRHFEPEDTCRRRDGHPPGLDRYWRSLSIPVRWDRTPSPGPGLFGRALESDRNFERRKRKVKDIQFLSKTRSLISRGKSDGQPIRQGLPEPWYRLLVRGRQDPGQHAGVDARRGKHQ